MSHSAELNEYVSSLRKRYNEIIGTQSKYDLAEQDILHFIEFEKCDAVTGSKLLKKLKEVRILRREIKNECEELQSILDKIDKSGLKNYTRPHKTYTYRTVTLESVLI